MKLGHFVSFSAFILSAWLGLTFMHEVPAQSYPKLQRHASNPTAASTPRPMPAITALTPVRPLREKVSP
jgi:hypothetical protein